jgi:hypothetical protein
LKIKKLMKRRMLRQWYSSWVGQHAERDNLDKAIRFRQRRVKVLLKYIVFRWRKEIKDQAKLES